MSASINWNTTIKEALDRTEFMAVSTIVDGESWICSVQFSYDQKCHLFFKSIPSARHMQNIKIDGRVSVAIFSTNRLPSGDVIGLQLTGTATILTSRDEVEVAAHHHYGRSEPTIDFLSKVDEHLGQNALWNFVKITPKELWYFNSELFDEETRGRQLVPLENLNIETNHY